MDGDEDSLYPLFIARKQEIGTIESNVICFAEQGRLSEKIILSASEPKSETKPIIDSSLSKG